jgi:ABC-type transport system involved in multi-copper enzyme maturation permease subunit
MSTVFKDLGLWFWRLAPANPILVRVVFAGGRRVRHLWIRIGYLSILAAVVVIGVLVKQSGVTSLADLAKNATRVFQVVSVVQLAMVCILAPIFTASAITQEKDSQTYNILLSTPLSNGQIVLGSLLSRLYFVLMLLVAGIPLFCIMMVYGGVTGDEIALSIALAAGTAAITGSLAITVSVIKIGTGRTIFYFYLAIALYLIAVFGLSTLPAFIPTESQPAPGSELRMSWLAAFHPFLALSVVLGTTPAPPIGDVASHAFPIRFLLAYPQYSYLFMTFGGSILLVLMSLSFVRRGAREGEITLWSRIAERLHLSSRTSAEGRAPRHVWHNPIAWRESVTGASAGGGFVLRYSVLGVGLAIAFVLLILHGKGSMTVVEDRYLLFLVVFIELGITLFIATASAATSMTREKEANTLELLLATPLTSGHIISGKIRGLVSAAGPMLLVPYTTVFLFVFYDFVSGRMKNPALLTVHWEALLLLPVLFISFTAFACMIGLQASIKSKRTMGAVFSSMALVLLVFFITGSCAMTIGGRDNPQLASAIMPLTPYAAMYVVVDPSSALSTRAATPPPVDMINVCRLVAAIACFCSAAIYGFIGVVMHRSMVRNFDMIIRKQSA